MVQQLKYGGALKFGKLIGELISIAAADAPRPDLLVPVPLHPSRLLDRGLDHTNLIAQFISRRLSIPVDNQLVSNTDARPAQSALNAKSRRRNMKNAFFVERQINSLNIAIIDDVVTTGATTDAMAGVLAKAGCDDISLWAFARTPDSTV